jgi:predicted AAA+ superfamily ATPase
MKFRYKDALWIDLLRPDILRSYLARPERLNEIVDGYNGKSQESSSLVIVIDEVQKAPALLPVVHSLIEDKRNLQFALPRSKHH